MLEPNIYHLKYFKTAAELQSIAAAAKKLGISQPAISQAIRKLEEALDCDLLIHTRNRFKLTEEGKILLEKSTTLLEQVDNLRADLRGKKSEVSGPLRIATSPEVAHYLFPSALKELQKELPKVRPSFEFGSTQEILNLVKSGEAEFGLVIDDGRMTGLEKKLLRKGHFHCIRSSRETATDATRFLVTRESPGLFELEKIFKEQYKKNVEIAVEVESWEVIAHYASLGLGTGLVPDFVAENHLGVKVSKTLWASKIEYRIYLVHKGMHQLSKAAQNFIRILQQNF
ncbi:LysR family transcriptional regulator [Bdellovibrio sp. 22V]|uniref:LysR family transcriptional regulator n=1 Tax=Bdellovibrio sp. 22V TaxID=3044166 RepID=UPI002543F555|nr:LysR family transcriptional regulator [Bdellovibrio sp. 22V]WII72364.1 LysR family transcriptional regulator [Bdellovibrio sp. 22V]